jgi:hypothetical protein
MTLGLPQPLTENNIMIFLGCKECPACNADNLPCPKSNEFFFSGWKATSLMKQNWFQDNF